MRQANQYLTFKDDEPGEAERLRRQWESGNLRSSIVVIILFAAHKHFLMTGKPAVITSLFRIKTTDTGVHEDWRAGDLRSRDLTNEQAQEWETSINVAFPEYSEYSSSPTAQTALIHAVRGEDGKSKGIHLHVQSPPLEPQPQDNPIV